MKRSLLLFACPEALGSIPVYVIFLFIINKYLDWMLTRIRVDLRSEFARNLVGIYSEFTPTRILPIPSGSERNDQNLVGMEIKFGWDFTQIPFLPNSYHSYQIPTIPTKFRLDPLGMRGLG